MLDDLVRRASAASPFYRQLYGGIDTRSFALPELPTVTKEQLMERFDDWVTDPSLKLAEVERHIEGLAGDDLYLGRYRVVASSGSTGRRVVFVYSRDDWLVSLANFLGVNEQFVGVHLRLPPRLRVAAVGATSPLHISVGNGLSVAVGVNRVLRLDARRPLSELGDALRAFQPEVVVEYPSAPALLADGSWRAGSTCDRPRSSPSPRCAPRRWNRRSGRRGVCSRSSGTASVRVASWPETASTTSACISSTTCSSWRTSTTRAGLSPTARSGTSCSSPTCSTGPNPSFLRALGHGADRLGAVSLRAKS